ncbi:hypothetical protein E2562_031860 [Oryza meyeriana var. granulata]|uniref:Uncharacterized protein n=1 Tax=Oryza meyeriana var. granulata TaxID=110450 RepID=A0A6G1C0I6_9ORYZ|nr:hypothetical protein E2562_031860 [Oryza meyeriana var. granulata]
MSFLAPGTAKGAIALADHTPSVLVVEHEDGEIGEHLAGAADLALPWQRYGGVRRGGERDGGDGEVLLPLADKVEAVAEGVAEVEGLDSAVEAAAVELGVGEGTQSRVGYDTMSKIGAATHSSLSVWNSTRKQKLKGIAVHNLAVRDLLGKPPVKVRVLLDTNFSPFSSLLIF